MPVSWFGVLRTLHVLAAAVTLGAVVAALGLRPFLHRHEDVRVAEAGLAYLERVDRTLVQPGAAALLVFGLLLVEGPVARFSFTAPGAGWLHLGSTLWLVLAAGLALMEVSRRGLQAAADDGATGGDRVATLWRRWTAGGVVAAAALVAAVAVMGLKLGV
jgi:uncharacterized membrane protein